MNWNFDTIFFFGFGLLSLWLGISGSKWLFWGVRKFDKLEQLLGRHYKKIVNITWGSICILISIYFLIS